ELHLEGLRLLLIGGVLAVGVLNYVPTIFGASALLLGMGCALELWMLAGLERGARVSAVVTAVGDLVLALVPWLAYWTVRRQTPAGPAFDRLWLAFRDRFGVLWSQRLREQFNRSTAHTGWPVVLTWRGLRRKPGAPTPDRDVQEAMEATLRALMKRFGPDEEQKE